MMRLADPAHAHVCSDPLPNQVG